MLLPGRTCVFPVVDIYTGALRLSAEASIKPNRGIFQIALWFSSSRKISRHVNNVLSSKLRQVWGSKSILHHRWLCKGEMTFSEVCFVCPHPTCTPETLFPYQRVSSWAISKKPLLFSNRVEKSFEFLLSRPLRGGTRRHQFRSARPKA